jgi:hypothetical protein
VDGRGKISELAEPHVTTSAPEPRQGSATDGARAALTARCDAVEACYEFMLAYAAQGLRGDSGHSAENEIREYLRNCDVALTGLTDLLRSCGEPAMVGPVGPYLNFIAVVDRDTRDSQAAVQLVLAQRSISSQLIDNLNASIHLRALLTDLFLVDEILKTNNRV